jgi:uncharacterized membrane protein YkgB
MILDTYLLVKQNMKPVVQDFSRIAAEDDVIESRIAYDSQHQDQRSEPSAAAYFQNDQSYTTSTILMLIISIILAIFVAYIFFNCIKSNCMSFLVFVIFLVLLNIPVVNIFALIGLFIYWLVYCRKGCKITK